MATFDVSPADVLRALKDARSGDVLKLRGEFPSIHVRKRDLPQSFDEPVTLDLTEASITGWQFTEVDGLSFIGGVVRPAAGAVANGVQTYSHGMRFNNCRRISSTGLRGRGPAAFEEGKPFVYGDGIAFWVLGGEDVTITNFDLRGFKNGVTLGKARRFRISGGACADMRSDGIQLAQCWEGGVTGNVIHSTRKRDNEHPDGIQMWSRPDAPPTSDIEISGNVIVGSSQGITGFNHVRNGVDDGGFDRLTITGNEITVDHAQALAVYNGRDLTIADNVIRTLPGATSRASLNLKDCTDVKRAGNVVSAGAGKAAASDPVVATAAMQDDLRGALAAQAEALLAAILAA